jgi:hypothetical protein
MLLCADSLVCRASTSRADVGRLIRQVTCRWCHGEKIVNVQGGIPQLRRYSKSRHRIHLMGAILHEPGLTCCKCLLLNFLNISRSGVPFLASKKNRVCHLPLIHLLINRSTRLLSDRSRSAVLVIRISTMSIIPHSSSYQPI